MNRIIVLVLLCLFFTGGSYSQAPPSDFDIMKWYWNGFPKRYKGWKVENKEKTYIRGYTEGMKHSVVSFTCDTCNYLCKYSFDVFFSYGFDDKSELTVQQNKDTTEKYMKIRYYNYPKRIREKL